MNTELLKKLSRFRLLSAQKAGLKIDLVRFSDDKAYARQMATTVLAQSDNEELRALAHELAGLPPSPNAKAPAGSDDKYVGRLR